MPEAVRVGDLTDHSMPIQGSGSPDVFIGGQKAWRALPAGVGKGLDEASTSVKKIMDKPPFTPPEVMPELPKLTAQMNKVAAQAEAAGAIGASATVGTAFTAFATQATALASAYVAGAAVPGGEPAARTAFTLGFQTGLSQTMSNSVKAIAGSWDMHTCMQAGPAGPHGPGVVIEGEPTVFINNLPVVAKGHKIVEAAGGVSTIQMGCGTVFFGNGGGGSSGGGGSQQKEAGNSKSGAKTGAKTSRSQQELRGAAASPADAPKSAAQKEKVSLWIRLEGAPEDTPDEKVVLSSTDGSYSVSKGVKDDQVPNDPYLQLKFEGLDPSLSYTLEVITEDGSYRAFEDVPYADLSSS